MKELNIDIIIMPTTAVCAPINKPSAHNAFHHSVFYTGVFNYLDFPAGTVPWRLVSEAECCYNHNEIGKDGKALGESMKGAEGMPIGIQVAGRPYREEEVLGVMKLIEEKAQYNNFPFEKVEKA
jgi:Asp-tRNA(Asn)/Glu-tRNA(Gln) amidotransferase A subunit family amidase